MQDVLDCWLEKHGFLVVFYAVRAQLGLATVALHFAEIVVFGRGCIFLGFLLVLAVATHEDIVFFARLVVRKLAHFALFYE